MEDKDVFDRIDRIQNLFYQAISENREGARVEMLQMKADLMGLFQMAHAHNGEKLTTIEIAVKERFDSISAPLHEHIAADDAAFKDIQKAMQEFSLWRSKIIAAIATSGTFGALLGFSVQLIIAWLK